MRALSELAREEGVLVVADEILTGMGRCGAMLASSRVGLRPDVVCVGKALGGGILLGASRWPSRSALAPTGRETTAWRVRICRVGVFGLPAWR